MTVSARPRLLCVDDDANVLAALRRQLGHRYDIVLALGAVAGLARLRDGGPFAVVLSDLHMPGIDGRAFLAEVRVLAPRTVALLLTGSTDVAGAADVDDDGLVFRQIAKPCLPAVLWDAIDSAIAHHNRAVDKEDPCPL
jgi:DNA-binding NtrC family response regulator